jgi:ketosteroid isomerase-like protein
MRVGRLGCVVWTMLTAAAAFASAAEQGSAKDRADLMRTDAGFSDAAQKIGIAAAFVKYADPDAVMLPANENPVTGADGIRKQFAGLSPGTTLTWKPNKAEAAASGDLGYTLGSYELRSKDKDGNPITRYGKYCSVWKKQPDGSWKWVVDVGTPSPAPQ